MPAKRAAKAPAKKAAKKATKKAPAKKAAPKRSAPRSAEAKYAAVLQKKFGELAAVTLTAERNAAAVVERIPTGVEVLDHYVLGGGGLPVGRMSEWFGGEGSGKTTLAYSVVASAQKAGSIVAWADPEYSFDPVRAALFGVDTDRLLILQPEHLEQLFNQLRMLLTMHDPRAGKLMIVWDSIAAMASASSLKRDAGDRKVGDVPQVMSEELKKVVPMLSAHRAHLMAINQVRANIGVMYGDKTTTPGGNAPKFYASQRVQILGGKAVKNSKNEHIAKVVTYLAVKNRLNFPFRKAKVRLDFATGYNNIWSTIWHAKLHKLVKCRAEGFAGPSREGLETYVEALEALGWPVPSDLPAPQRGRVESDADEMDEEEDFDVDVDEEDADGEDADE